MVKKVMCEVYSRIVGYFRPVENWNEGKKQEFSERVMFEVGRSNMTNKPMMQTCEIKTKN